MSGGHGRAPRAGSPMLTSSSSQKMCTWIVSCCLALQHLAVQTSLLCIFHLLLLPTLPPEPPHAHTTSKLLARSLFACGISTVLQTTLGSRLPLVQIPSFEYLVPAMVLSSHLSPGASTDRNGTAMASTCLVPRCRDTGSWADSLQEVSGAVLISGLIQLVLGVSGTCGWAARHCGPMVLAPSLSIIGLSAYKEAAFFCSTNWGVALLLMLLAVTFSQHLRSCRLPFCSWPHAWEGSTEYSVPTLRTFSVLLPFAGVCTVCAILRYFHIPWESLDMTMAQLSWANSTFSAPWIHIPYAGEWRWPLLTPRVLAVGIAMAIGCSMNSVGCYVLCGRLLRVPQLPPHACNRGLCMEGLGSLLAGLLGTPGGTASSIANTCATGLTQAGSRLSVQVSALVCMVLGMSPRLAGLLTHIPLAVHGTLEERGLLSEQPWKARANDYHLHGERGEGSQAYRLPTGLRRLLPSSCKAFPCCFLCPRSEEEEEGSCATDEGTAAPGEGTHLLPKSSSGELQPAIRPSQTDMPAWHTVA
ncbi:solute carrier family 23 member 3 isoform X3 [Cinclus cinclus]|uniref:solute carrier family 23 member 3 isoform X3 n=1 Tax=Cinclus cinclus TaxID=127875 RepID=UPI002E15D753